MGGRGKREGEDPEPPPNPEITLCAKTGSGACLSATPAARGLGRWRRSREPRFPCARTSLAAGLRPPLPEAAPGSSPALLRSLPSGSPAPVQPTPAHSGRAPAAPAAKEGREGAGRGGAADSSRWGRRGVGQAAAGECRAQPPAKDNQPAFHGAAAVPAPRAAP